MMPPLTDADVVAEIPDGVPVRLEYDVTANAYRYVALTPQELKQRDDDAAVSAAQEAEEQADDAAKAALVAKLTSGKATNAEVQQAIAIALGAPERSTP